MKRITGTLLATAASISIELGFVPSQVRVVNLSTMNELLINREVASGLRFGRITTASTGVVTAAASAAAGLADYDGASPLAADSTTVLVEDLTDHKGTIGAFTLDTPASLTGHFDAGVTTAIVGIGSKVVIGGETATIVGMTNDGDAADEITLDKALSGSVQKIQRKVTYTGAEAGDAISAGFTLGATAAVNVDTNVLFFEAIG